MDKKTCNKRTSQSPSDTKKLRSLVSNECSPKSLSTVVFQNVCSKMLYTRWNPIITSKFRSYDNSMQVEISAQTSPWRSLTGIKSAHNAHTSVRDFTTTEVVRNRKIHLVIPVTPVHAKNCALLETRRTLQISVRFFCAKTRQWTPRFWNSNTSEILMTQKIAWKIPRRDLHKP